MKTLEHTPLLPNEHSAITEAVNLLKTQFPIEHVILFGSKTRGDDDEYSDIDLVWRGIYRISYLQRDLTRRSECLMSHKQSIVTYWIDQAHQDTAGENIQKA